MRSRSKILAYDTQLVEVLTRSASSSSYQSLGGNTTTANPAMQIGSFGSVYPDGGWVSISDIPLVKIGSYYHRDPVLVLARLQSLWSDSWRTSYLLYQRSLNTAAKPVTFLKKIHLKDMNDLTNPGFRKKSQQGEILLSPMDSSERLVEAELRLVGNGESLTHAVTHYTVNGANIRYYYSRVYSYDVKAYGIPVDQESDLLSQTTISLMDRQNAVNSAFDAVNSADFDLPLFIAEGRETMATVTLAIVRLARIISKIRKFDFSDIAPNTWRDYLSNVDAKQTADFLSAAWLEARYAWRPLVGDIESGYKFFMTDKSTNQRRVFRGYDLSSSSNTFSGSLATSVSGGSITNSFSVDFSTEQSARAGVIVEFTSSLAKARNLGFTDIAGLAWELVPWSFVIDWIVNVKGFLSALNSSAGLDQRGSFASVRAVKDGFGTFSCSCPWGTASGLTIHLQRISYDRSVNNESSFTPTIDINFDIYKLVDAVSLLWRLR